MYNVYLFDMLFTKFLLTQMFIWSKNLSRRMQMVILFLIKKYLESQQKAILKFNKIY